ncbi:MAG: hypothetical protein JWO57_3253 [Pseudonocardiales bacterium]|nr:hypothetical protein [Pseudonocardiales bacterium]
MIAGTRASNRADGIAGALRPVARAAVAIGLAAGLLAAAPVATAAPPAAPGLLGPGDAAQVVVPLTLSWSAATSPSGIVAYNWQVSPSSTFVPVVQQNSTSGQTQDSVSGLANGTYFWRVQAVNGAFEQGAWSQTRSFTVTGANGAEPGTPTLNQPRGGTQFHPFESITFTWSAVQGAATYVFEADKNPSFPVGTTRIHADNVTDPTTTIVIGDFCNGCEQGNYVARVYAVGANGARGVPSATVSFSVFYNNPLPPPPTPLAPVNGVTVSLPITLSWTDVPNPQGNGYQIQISRNSAFTSIEDDIPLITPSHRDELSLTSGPKFWRVRSFQGDNSPNTAAATAWSQTATFTVSSAPPTVVSVSLTRADPFSGDDEFGDVQLSTVAPSGGAVVRLTSSNPTAVPVPASVTVPGGKAVLFSSFAFQIGQVTSPTAVTVTASLGSSSATFQVNVRPPSLQTLTLTPTTTSGGVAVGAIMMLNGQAPASGAIVSLSSSSPAATPPATVTVAAGSPSASFAIPTNDVTTRTPVTITASWNGSSVQSQLIVMPAPKPTSLALFPATTTGSSGSVQGSVSVASVASFDQSLQVASNNSAVLPFLSSSVTIPAGSDRGAIQILPRSVSTTTVVTISVTGGGVTVRADLTVNPDSTPPPGPTLSTFAVNPTSVPGGHPATGTVTLPSAAPAGGTIVTLSSNLPNAASVPGSVTVPAGATSASFTVTTFQVADTTVQLSARNGDTILFAALGITTAAPAPSLSALTLTPSSVPGGNPSTGKVTLTAAAPSGGAQVTLSSSKTATASVPASVTIAAGGTSATFTVSTSAVSTPTSTTIGALYGGASATTTLTVTPPGQSATLTVTATGRSGTTITSNPPGIKVTVGTTGSAPFPDGSTITLTASSGRSAVWSGACSSNGSKTKSCTLTLSGNSSVTANVN